MRDMLRKLRDFLGYFTLKFFSQTKILFSKNHANLPAISNSGLSDCSVSI